MWPGLHCPGEAWAVLGWHGLAVTRASNGLAGRGLGWPYPGPAVPWFDHFFVWQWHGPNMICVGHSLGLP
jgi:hypothetical protein